MKNRNIPIAGPWVTEREINYTKEAAANGWYENSSYWNNKFEKAFSKYIGSEYSISLPHCTSGIHLSLEALGINQGDEVIIPDITWIATAAPLKYVGAQPVFADVNLDTWCICHNSIKKLITPKTKAIIPVDLYGSMPNFDEINKIAKKYNLKIIEDAAEGFGSEINKKMAGKFGHTGVFSFHGSKTITTGEGGMLVTDDEKIYERILFLRDHGRIPGDTLFENSEIAFKYKMSPLQAAFGLGQIERAKELVEKKIKIYNWYKKRLGNNELLTLNHESPHVKNSFWMTTIIFSNRLNLNKKELIYKLSEEGINTRPFFNPLSSLAAYANCKEAKKASLRNSNALSLCSRGLNLPSALCLEEEDIDYVCQRLLKILGQYTFKES